MNHLELRDRVLNYYDSINIQDPELKECLNQLRTAEDWLQVVFPYEWTKDFLNDIPVPELVPGGKYVDVYLKSCPQFKLRLPASNPEEIWYRQFYLQLVATEQCYYSPHKYKSIPKNCSVIDVGGSEGIFGYFNAFTDGNNEFHIFDEAIWEECAKHNLQRVHPSDVVFYNQYVDSTNPPVIKLGKPLGSVKIDVDGPEIDVLNALESYILEFHPQVQVAVYHYADEYSQVREWLFNHGYQYIVPSSGWMLYPNDDNQEPPFFRRGLVIAE